MLGGCLCIRESREAVLVEILFCVVRIVGVFLSRDGRRIVEEESGWSASVALVSGLLHRMWCLPPDEAVLGVMAEGNRLKYLRPRKISKTEDMVQAMGPAVVGVLANLAQNTLFSILSGHVTHTTLNCTIFYVGQR